MMKTRITLLLASIITLPSFVNAAVISLISDPFNSGNPENSLLTTTSVDRNLGQDDSSLLPTTVPSTNSISSSVGLASSVTEYTFSNTGFDFLFNQSLMPGGGETRAYGIVYFTINENVNYNIAGAFTAQSADTHEMYFRAILTDLTTDHIFLSQQAIGSTNPSLILGEEMGNRSNTLLGDMSGILYADIPYRLIFNANFSNMSPTSSGGTAQGTLALNISEVPLPPTYLLMLSGLIGLVTTCKKHKSKSV